MASTRVRWALPVLVGTVLVLASGAAQAVPVTIQNPSFEANVLADGAFVLTITNWSFSGSDTGTFNPHAAAYPGGVAPDGQNVAFISAGSAPGDTISQVLSDVLTAGVTYTLDVEVGERADGLTINTYVIQLVAGGAVLASDSSASPAAGTFATSTVVYTATGAEAQIGQALEIRLVATVGGGNQINFDDVRLDAARQVPVVPGVGLAFLVVALAGLGLLVARRV